MPTKVECVKCGSKHFRILIHVGGAVDTECVHCGTRCDTIDDWSADLFEEFQHEVQTHEKNATALVQLQGEYKKLVDRAEVLNRRLEESKYQAATFEKDLKDAVERLNWAETELNRIRKSAVMMEEGLKMHTAEKAALLRAIKSILNDDDNAEQNRELLHMILSGGRQA